MRQALNTLANFLRSKVNLTLIQCILYFTLGYILREHYTWQQFVIIFVVLLGIQFVTHIKGVAHGMMLHQFMVEGQHDMMKYIDKIQKEHKDEKPN